MITGGQYFSCIVHPRKCSVVSVDAAPFRNPKASSFHSLSSNIHITSGMPHAFSRCDVLETTDSMFGRRREKLTPNPDTTPQIRETWKNF